jgi:hypothetical protein
MKPELLITGEFLKAEEGDDVNNLDRAAALTENVLDGFARSDQAAAAAIREIEAALNEAEQRGIERERESLDNARMASEK